MKPILGKAGRAATPAWAALAFAGLAVSVVSALPAAAADLGTLPATLVRRFNRPVVREVIGGENGGRELALVADVDDREDFSDYPKWVWWTRRPSRQSWSFFRVDQGRWIHWPGRMMAVERASPETIYFVDDAWILRRSTDGGETWTERSRTPGEGEPIRLQAGERPGVLFLIAIDPDALFRSTDGGLTWKDLGRVVDLVATLAFTPDDPDLVIGYAPGAIVRSRDGGATFTDISPGRWVGAHDLAVAPSDASIVYALDSPPFLRRSRNGGTTWRPLGPPVAGLVGLALAVDPRRPNHLVVLAVPQDEEESGIPRAFESFDGGIRWRTGGSVSACRLRFVVDEQGLRLEAFGRRGLYESRDGGATWRLADDGITADHDLLLAAASAGETVYLAEEKDRELWRSTDGGRTWERKWRFPDTVNQLLVSPSDPDRLVANVTAPDLIRSYRLWWSEDAGASWNEIPRPGEEVDEGEAVSVSSLSFHPALLDGLYAGSYSDAWRTVNRGRTWERLTAMLPGSEECSDATGSCWENRNAPIVVPDPLAPARLYTLYLSEWMRSDDSGQTWVPLAEPLNYFEALIPDPHVRDRVYLGMRESAQVFVSDRAGNAPSQLLFSSPGTTAPYRGTWMTLDGEGNLLLQPDERANVFFRQREQGGWDRFSLRLPSAEITRLVAGPRLPGGGSVLFVVQQGIGLWRVELPGPAKSR